MCSQNIIISTLLYSQQKKTLIFSQQIHINQSSRKRMFTQNTLRIPTPFTSTIDSVHADTQECRKYWNSLNNLKSLSQIYLNLLAFFFSTNKPLFKVWSLRGSTNMFPLPFLGDMECGLLILLGNLYPVLCTLLPVLVPLPELL